MIHYTHNHNDGVICPVYTSYCCRSEKRYSKYLMDTLSMLLTMCSLEDQGVRLAANETLNKLVKATYLTHITKIQMTAFNEMKKVSLCTCCPCMCILTTHRPTGPQTHCAYVRMCVIHTCTHVHSHSTHLHDSTPILSLLPLSLLRTATVAP